MVFSGAYPGAGVAIPYVSSVYDDGATKWVLLDVGRSGTDATRHLFVANLDSGAIAHAFRMAGSTAASCRPFIGALGEGRFAMPFTDSSAQDSEPMSVVTVVAKLASSDVPAFSPVATISAGGGPVAALANGRVGLNWNGGVRVTSLDWDTAQAPAELGIKTTYGELTDFAGTPGGFVNGAITNPHPHLLQTDGLNVESLLLKDAAADLMAPQFTGTHLTWLRGLGYDGGMWKKIEIWASPYSWDAAGLAPQYVADWPFAFPGDVSRAAFGRLMQTAGIDGGDMVSAHVWSIPDGEHRRVEIPAAAGLKVGQSTGLTKDDVVFTTKAAKGLYDTGLWRVPIAKMPIVTP